LGIDFGLSTELNIVKTVYVLGASGDPIILRSPLPLLNFVVPDGYTSMEVSIEGGGGGGGGGDNVDGGRGGGSGGYISGTTAIIASKGLQIDLSGGQGDAGAQGVSGDEGTTYILVVDGSPLITVVGGGGGGAEVGRAGTVVYSGEDLSGIDGNAGSDPNGAQGGAGGVAVGVNEQGDGGNGGSKTTGGNPGDSGEFIITLRQPVTNTAITDLSATDITSAGFKLTWTDESPGGTYTFTINNQIIPDTQYDPKYGGVTKEAIFSDAFSSGIVGATQYDISMEAVYDGDATVYASNQITIRTPIVPPVVTLTQDASTQINVGWDMNTNAGGTSVVRIDSTTANTQPTINFTQSTEVQQTATITDIEENRLYTVSVTVSLTNFDDVSANDTITSWPLAPTIVPTVAAAESDISGNSATITWTAASDVMASTGEIITNVLLAAELDADMSAIPVNNLPLSTAASSYEITGLEFSTPYTFYIFYVNAAGFTRGSVSFTTTADSSATFDPMRYTSEDADAQASYIVPAGYNTLRYGLIGGGAYGSDGFSGGLNNGGNGGGGSGAGPSTTFDGGSGTANTGGGGGGGPGTATGTVGSGGSGVVVIRYAGSQRGTGGTVTSASGYTYHTFTASGTYTA
jgi:hypothetical protein